MTSLGKNAMARPTPFDTANRQPGCRDMPPSEGRLGIDKAVLFGHGNDHLGLGQLEFGRYARLVRSLILSSFSAFRMPPKKAGPGSMPGPSLIFRRGGSPAGGGASWCQSVPVRAGPDELEAILALDFGESCVDRSWKLGSSSLTER